MPPKSGVQKRSASDIAPPTALFTWADYENLRYGEELSEPPAHWPDDAKVSKTRWAHWLPADWGQAVRIRPSDGAEKITFISPEGRSFDARTPAEKAYGGFPDGYNPPEWPDWMGKDWAMGDIEQSGKTKRIFITPCGTQFYWGKGDFERRSHMGGSPISLGDEVLEPWRDWQRRNGYLCGAKEELPTKKRKVDQDVEATASQSCSFGEETDNEISNIDVGNLADNTFYDLRPCRSGSAWIALPRDVLSVSLDWVSSHFTKEGWTLASKTESRAVFAAKGTKPHVAFYYDKGKLLMKTKDKGKALRVAELYDDWLAAACEDPEEAEGTRTAGLEAKTTGQDEVPTDT